MTTGKTIVLTIQTFVGKVMSLLFNTLSTFVIAFLPRTELCVNYGHINMGLIFLRASLVDQIVKNPQCKRPGFDPWVGKIPWRREWLPTPVFLPG